MALANTHVEPSARPEVAGNLTGVATVADRDDHAVRQATFEELGRASSDGLTLCLRLRTARTDDGVAQAERLDELGTRARD